MSYKTPKIAFVTSYIRQADKKALVHMIQGSSIKDGDRGFLTDCVSGMRYKDLSEKYHKSMARIYQWKRTVYEALFDQMRRMT